MIFIMHARNDTISSETFDYAKSMERFAREAAPFT